MFDLNPFTTVIELMCAVNFIYIVAHFPTEVLNTFFQMTSAQVNEESFKAEISVETPDNASTAVQNLEETDNANIARRLENEVVSVGADAIMSTQKNVENQISRTTGVKGSKCLFLFASLFCIMLLLAEAIETSTESYQVGFAIMLFSMFSTCYTIRLVTIMWRHRWDSETDSICYRKAVRTFGIIVLLTITLTVANSICISYGIEYPLWMLAATTAYILAIILPFVPCVSSFVFVWKDCRHISGMTNRPTDKVTNKQADIETNIANIQSFLNDIISKIAITDVGNEDDNNDFWGEPEDEE